MRTVPLGSTANQVPSIIAGMMRIADKTDEEIRGLYCAARDAGIDYFDHADLYGFNHPGGSGLHECETSRQISPKPRQLPTSLTQLSP